MSSLMKTPARAFAVSRTGSQKKGLLSAGRANNRTRSRTCSSPWWSKCAEKERAWWNETNPGPGTEGINAAVARSPDAGPGARAAGPAAAFVEQGHFAHSQGHSGGRAGSRQDADLAQLR